MGKPSGLVESVVVDPKLHGKGIGKLMMTSALNICKQNKCYKVALSANLKREPAHKFYELLGFKQHGISFITEFSE